MLNLAGRTLTLTNRIPINGNPEKMLLNQAQSKLFVTVANADALVISEYCPADHLSCSADLSGIL